MQSAYRKFHSTETALLCVQNDILRAIDSGSVVVLVMLDLSAAFDTIDHDILIHRLDGDFGVKGSALDWFSSYLSGRYQQVNIQGATSVKKELKFGVPQGSVLGPDLFVAYAKPIGQIARKHGLKVHIYADDTQLYLMFDPNIEGSRDDTIKKIERCITEIRIWMNNNQLKLNDDKTEVIVFGTKQKLSQLGEVSVQIGDATVKQASSAKNLGVLLDPCLDMQLHVRAVCKACYLQIRSIGKIRKYLTTDATKTLIQANVTSRLDYANSLLYGLPQSTLNQMQRVQNTAARLVSRCRRYDHISPVLKDLHWLPIHKRINYKILLHTYHCLNGQAPDYLSDLLQKAPERNRRAAYNGKLIIPRSRLSTYGDRSFSVAAPKLWNDLPIHIKTAKTVQSFKTQLKSHLFNL